MSIAVVSSLLVFVTVLLLLRVVAGLVTRRAVLRQEHLRNRLNSVAGLGRGMEGLGIVRIRTMSDVPWLHRLLKRFGFVGRISLLLESSGVKTNVGTILLSALLLGVIGFSLGRLFLYNTMVGVLLGIVFGAFPFLWLKSRKAKRMARFEVQLPEAMDMISRALRAGHAFTNSLKLIADEFEDPMGEEFRKVVDEINFGAGVDRALENLIRRVDVPDLKFFVTAVNIQRESGGNLAEILTTISRLIRERFSFRRQVKTLSAEGRISAIVLCALPFVVGAFIYTFNNEYLSELLNHPLGMYVIMVQLVLMGLGMVVISKMVKIEV
jgi:tight adherence protein B